MHCACRPESSTGEFMHHVSRPVSSIGEYALFPDLWTRVYKFFRGLEALQVSSSVLINSGL